jgi:hypothetical protein
MDLLRRVFEVRAAQEAPAERAQSIEARAQVDA